MMNHVEVLQWLQERLRQPQPALLRDIAVTVLTQGVREDGDWLYVPVQATPEPSPRYPYYEALGDIEDEAKARFGCEILLVPVS